MEGILSWREPLASELLRVWGKPSSPWWEEAAAHGRSLPPFSDTMSLRQPRVSSTPCRPSSASGRPGAEGLRRGCRHRPLSRGLALTTPGVCRRRLSGRGRSARAAPRRAGRAAARCSASAGSASAGTAPAGSDVSPRASAATPLAAPVAAASQRPCRAAGRQTCRGSARGARRGRAAQPSLHATRRAAPQAPRGQFCADVGGPRGAPSLRRARSTGHRW